MHSLKIRWLQALLVLLVAITLAAQAKTKASPEERRAEIRDMRTAVLKQLFADLDDSRQILEDAYGYAIFSNKGMNLLMFSTARGAGILRDHRDGNDIYMKAFGAGTGVGAGLKNYTVVLVFKTESALDDFRRKGWEVTGQADANVDEKNLGKEVSKSLGPGVLTYQLTESGFALQALAQAFRYWADKELNPE